jgi:oligopeptidase B
MSLSRNSLISLTVAGLFCFLTMSKLPQPHEGQDSPPVARVIPHEETRFGMKVVDNYYWLRDKSNPEVIKYLEQENAYTQAMTKDLKSFEDVLYNEMLSHVKETDLDVPVRRGDYYYYSRTEKGKQYPIRCRKKGSLEGKEEVLLDLNELGRGKEFVGLGAFEVSDDQNLLAYTLDYTGYRQFTLKVKDLRSGMVLFDTMDRVDSVAWGADNRTLFVVTEDAVTKRSNRAWRHVLGQKDSEPIYEEEDETFRLSVEKTRDKKYIMLGASSTDTSDVRYLRADQPQGTFSLFLPREKRHRYFVDHRENLFYIRSDKDAKNFQVLTAPEGDPSPTNWKVFIAHDQNVLIEDIDLFRDFAVSVEKSQALNRLRVLDFKTGNWNTITFPEPVYSAFPGETPEFTSTTYRYTYQSLVTPPSVFDFDTQTGKSILRKQQEVPGYDPSQYVSERQWVTARDGVKVPLSVVYKRGFQRDGTRRLLLYAYGSYGFGYPATFSAERLVLLDRGLPFVIAHIRGGNDMGEAWHDDGKLMHKKNTFNDFIDCAEYLIHEKWTSKQYLLIEGASAGGLLMGAVVNMRPDLFKAVHLGVPFVDVMNDMFDPTLPLTTTDYPEWGNPTNDKAVYDYVLSYSPYDNLRKAAYPPMLLTESLNDSQVAYWEAAKFVAKARTLKTDDSPILLKMKMDPAGHGGASGRYDKLRDRAFECAWLLSEVGIKK